MLCDRIGAQDHKECQEDILAVSGMAEDIRDALLNYQVGNNKVYVVVILLTLDTSIDNPATGII